MPLNDQQIKKLTDAGYSKEMIVAYSNFKESGGQSNLGEQAFMADTGLSPTYQRQTDAITDFATSIYNGIVPSLGKAIVAMPNLAVGAFGDNFASRATESFQNKAFELIDNNLKGYVDPKYQQQLLSLNEKDELQFADARSFANGLGQGIGSMLSFLIPGAGFAKAGMGLRAATMVSGTLISAPMIYESGKEAGLSNADNVRMTLALSPIIGAIELVGGMEADALSKMLGKKVAKNVAEEAVEQIGKKELTSALSGLAGKGISSADDFAIAMKGGLKWGVKNVLSKKNIGNALGEGAEEYLQGTVQKAGEQLYDNLFAEGKEKGEGAYGTQLLLPEEQEGKGVLGTRYSKEAFYEDFSAAIYGGIIGGGMSQLTNPVVNQSLYGYIDLAVRKGKGQEAIGALQNIVNAEVQAGRIQDPNAAMESIGRMFNVAEQLKGADNKKMNASLRYELYDSQYNIRPQFEAIVQNYEAQLTALEETLQNDPTNTISIIEQKKAIAEGFDDYNRATEGIAAANANIQSIATQYKPIDLKGELLTIKNKTFNIQDNPRVNSLIYGMGTPLPQLPPSPAGGGTTAVQPKPANLSSLIGANISVGSVSGTIAFSPESGYSLIEDNGNETPLGLDDIDITTIGGTYDPDSVSEVITEDLGFAEEVKDEKPTPTETTDEESGLVEITPDPGLESEQPQPEVIPATSPTIVVTEEKPQIVITETGPAVETKSVEPAAKTDELLSEFNQALNNLLPATAEDLATKYTFDELNDLLDEQIAQLGENDPYVQIIKDAINLRNNVTESAVEATDEIVTQAEESGDESQITNINIIGTSLAVSRTDGGTQDGGVDQVAGAIDEAGGVEETNVQPGQTTLFQTAETVTIPQGTAAAEGQREVVGPLKDVESTAKALDEIRLLDQDKFVADFSKLEIPFKQENIKAEMESEVKKDLFPNENLRKKYAENTYSAVVRSSAFPKILSEAYHKAKADGSNPELVKAVEELLKPTTDEAAKQENVQPVSEGVQGVRTQEQERKEGTELRAGKEKEVKPIRQLGTGANVYFESKFHRVNDGKNGKVLLNIGGTDGGMAIANIEFDNAADAVTIAEQVEKDYPKGVPDAILIDKYIQGLKNQLLTTKTETNAKEQQGGPVRGQGEQVAAEGRGDSNLPESDQAKLQDRKAQESQKRLEGKQIDESKSISEKYNESEKVYAGDETETWTVTLPDDTEVEVRVVLGDALSITPSHNPITFSKSKGFPLNSEGKTVNDNDYENSPEAQALVVKMGMEVDDRAIEDKPFVKDGIVYSGNNRTMSRQRAALDGTDAKFIERLRQRARLMGFTKEQVDKFKSPMIWYEIVSPMTPTTENFRRFNAKDTKSKSPLERAVELGKTIKERRDKGVVRTISGLIANYDTMAEFFASKDAAKAFVYLENQKLITDKVFAEYIPNGKITAAGKEFLESLILGVTVSEENLRNLTGENNAETRKFVAAAAKQLLDNESLESFSIMEQINKAIAIQIAVNRMRKPGQSYESSLYEYVTNMVLPFEKKEMSPEALLLNMLLAKGEKDFRAGVSAYNDRAISSSSGQGVFFGEATIKDKRTIIEEVLSLYDKRLTEVEKRVMRTLEGIESGGSDASIATTQEERSSAKNELNDLLANIC